MQQFQVRKDDLAETRVTDIDETELADGEILVGIDRFALTANNVTYGVVGERIGYWKFFPADDGWGVIPVWGFANVIESRHPDIEEGERLYGFFPMATRLRILPDKVGEQRFVDAAPHRAGLPAVYNSYARTTHEPHTDPSMEDERALLFPLYATSFCIADFLEDNGWFGAEQIVIGSASSKTAIGIAYALQAIDGAPALVALTSARNVGRVQEMGLYSSVVTYDSLTDIDATKRTVIVDMSGNGAMLSDLHRHLRDNMAYTSNVGITHYDDNEMGPDFITERSAMFFAPSHIQKRAEDWGPGEFEKKAFAFWHGAAKQSGDWLSIEVADGLDGLSGAYSQVLEGRSSPEKGIIVAL